ncbi:MAG: DNA topoisomerase, partial [Bacteroidetes bacterium]|nr:DNA topoisomerase [Bacteroidota bacterium]
RDEARLYELIYKRTMASQMSDAQLERTKVSIAASSHKTLFIAQGEVITFEGFLKVYLEGTDDEDDEENGLLPQLEVGQTVDLVKLTATERFSRPPYRYSEAALVKKLEELGIGRPSTYAATISRIMDKKYVEKGVIEGIERSYRELRFSNGEVKTASLTEKVGADKGKLVPTDIGFVVSDFLIEHFPSIVDYHFTAEVEEKFDQIAAGEIAWRTLMREFYDDFHPTVNTVSDTADRASGERFLGTDPQTGRQVIVRLGRFGPMAQIGSPDDSDPPRYAGLLPHQSITSITFEEALDLFKLPRTLGDYKGEQLEANIGRFGPYVKYGKKFVSLEQQDSAFEIALERAIELIEAKERADAPIFEYEGHGVTKGSGRFGPFIKWNGLFINVNKRYDFDQLSESDMVALIEEKKVKEREKLIAQWPEEGIRIEKARWGRHTIISGKTKLELAKEVDVTELTLEEVKSLLEASKPKKAAVKKKASTKKK